jgi:glycosidase
MKKLITILSSICLLVSLSSCNNVETTTPAVFDPTKGNTAYQILIYSFNSSDGDGMGDFKGITERVNYLKDLGITLVWLSPLHKASSYHGYDVIDYYSVNPDYGTIDDFKEMVNAFHNAGISVILDMVLNHTSRSNQWFIDACQNKNGKRDWYVWKKDGVSYGTTGSYAGQFYDDRTCNGSFFSSFGTSMPDLNLNNQDVVKEQKKILKYWLDLGVDGFRYDAIKHFFDVTELPKDADRQAYIDKYMKNINGFVHSYKKNSYIVGEYLEMDYRSLLKFVPYFDTEFDFPWYDRMLKAINGTNITSYVSVYNDSIEAFTNLNKNWINSTIISNHDHDRIMSIVTGNEAKARLAFNLQMLLPGMPFVYYGDEVGLKGARYNNNDIERRLPFTWGDTWYRVSADSYGPGLYRTDINDNVASVVDQLENPDSLLNYYKKVINYRNSEPIIYDGEVTAYDANNSRVISYKLTKDNKSLVVIHNVSISEQEVDYKSEFKNIVLNSEVVRIENNKIYLPSYMSIVIEL